jgi:subtilisin family serine protease
MVKVAIIKSFRVLLVLAFVFGTVLATGQAEAQEEAFTELKPAEIIGEYAPGELLVKFKPGVAISQIEEIEATLGVSRLKTIPRIDVRVMRIPEGRGLAEMIESFRKSPWVEYAEPNYRCYKTEIIPDDTYFSSQWALSKIDAPEGWETTTGSPSIIIAIIDDGIDYNHEEFLPSGKLWINTTTGKPGYDFGMSDDDVMHESGSGHGTATAGIAAAATNNAEGIAGVSWHSVIMPLKVEDSSGYIYHNYIADAITFAVDEGAQIISMSLGGPGSSATLENACRYAWENGVVVVCSSGNENTEISYPARYPTTIAVGATNEIDYRIYPGNQGNKWPSPQGSNYGPELDVVAPGINIYATDWSASGEGYDPGAYTASFGGTSASCPFVAGEAALLLAKDPTLSHQRIRSIIRSSAEDQACLCSEDPPGFDIYYGSGRINLNNALLAPTKPDLTLASSDITFSNDNPSPGVTITISAYVHNDGSVYNEINTTPFASVLTDIGYGFYVDSRFSVAQSFTATTDGYLALVSLAMVDWGSDSAYAQVEIQTDSGGKPSGTSISSAETQDWPSSAIWNILFFSNPAELTAGNKYWIVVTCPDSSENGYLWLFNDGSVYAGGGMSGWDDEAASPSWTTESATYDCLFGTYTYAYNTVIRFYDGEPGAGGTQIGPDQHLSPIAASGTKTASVQWTAISGSHNIYVVADPGNVIPESDDTNNKAYRSLSAGEVISFTVTDLNGDGVKFAMLVSGMPDQPADQTDIQGAVTLTVKKETTVDVIVQICGDDFTGPGTETIPVENVKYNSTNSLTGARTLTTSYDTWYSVGASPGEDNVTQVYFWITIPPLQTSGIYTSTFYYQAIES